MKKMLKPEIEFIKFSNEDVITTSGELVKYSLPQDELIDGEDVQSYGPAIFDINDGFPGNQ